MKDFKNDLLNRREVKLIMNSSGNPGLAKSLQLISEQFKVPTDQIVIKGVKGKFGRDTFLIDAMVYDSVKNKDKIERKPKVKAGEAAAAGAVGAKK